jgi:hypothetical protein
MSAAAVIISIIIVNASNGVDSDSSGYPFCAKIPSEVKISKKK